MAPAVQPRSLMGLMDAMRLVMRLRSLWAQGWWTVLCEALEMRGALTVLEAVELVGESLLRVWLIAEALAAPEERWSRLQLMVTDLVRQCMSTVKVCNRVLG